MDCTTRTMIIVECCKQGFQDSIDDIMSSFDESSSNASLVLDEEWKVTVDPRGGLKGSSSVEEEEESRATDSAVVGVDDIEQERKHHKIFFVHVDHINFERFQFSMYMKVLYFEEVTIETALDRRSVAHKKVVLQTSANLRLWVGIVVICGCAFVSGRKSFNPTLCGLTQQIKHKTTTTTITLE